MAAHLKIEIRLSEVQPVLLRKYLLPILFYCQPGIINGKFYVLVSYFASDTLLVWPTFGKKTEDCCVARRG